MRRIATTTPAILTASLALAGTAICRRLLTGAGQPRRGRPALSDRQPQPQHACEAIVHVIDDEFVPPDRGDEQEGPESAVPAGDPDEAVRFSTTTGA